MHCCLSLFSSTLTINIVKKWYNCSSWSFLFNLFCNYTPVSTLLRNYCISVCMCLCTSDMIYLHLPNSSYKCGWIRRPIEEILKLLPGPHSETKRVSKFVALHFLCLHFSIPFLLALSCIIPISLNFSLSPHFGLKSRVDS